MGSKKRSARAKEIAQFKSQLGSGDLFGGQDDIFAREERRVAQQEQDHQDALRRRGCERKNRYMSRFDAEAAISSCAEYGTSGLRCYKCEYCGGWHLTSRKEN